MAQTTRAVLAKQATNSAKKAPLLLAGPRGWSCSAGGWVVSRSRAHSPIRDGGIGSRDGRPPASYSREGRERFGGARCCYYAGVCPIPPQPPRGATPAKPENKKR